MTRPGPPEAGSETAAQGADEPEPHHRPSQFPEETFVDIVSRDDRPEPTRFRQGAHQPYAIRWFGSSALFGHLRHLIATAVANESIDTRDWMRPQRPISLLRSIVRVLRADEGAPTLVESLNRPLWIDFVADMGDDHDLSLATARMIFHNYAWTKDGIRYELPRGDILLCGGDTAYPVATVDEIKRRLTEPWNEVIKEVGVTRPRVLLGVPGNHDWYDGLDGFARLFRRNAEPTPNPEWGPAKKRKRASSMLLHGRKRGLFAKQLHLDEVGESISLLASTARSVTAFVRGEPRKRRKRIGLLGYEAVQETSFWSVPIAPNLEMWGVDRQLRRMDFRQRSFFLKRRDQNPDTRILFCSADPAMTYGERHAPGANLLSACALSLERNSIFYISGDTHHYERRVINESQHIIAGGGGAFLHGTRISPSPTGPPARAYPSAATSRRIVSAVPFKMTIGRAGFLPHLTFGLLALFQGMAAHEGAVTEIVVTSVITLLIAGSFYLNVGLGGRHPRYGAAVAIPFGIFMGIAPVLIRLILPHVWSLPSETAVVVVYAFFASFVFGSFLTICSILGIEHEQAFAALGHPGFRHFIRMRIDVDGSISAWTIGKDDPIAPGKPEVIDHVDWR